MKKILIIFLFIIASQFIGNFVLAGCVCNSNSTSDTETACKARPSTDLCTWSESSTSAGTVKLINPIGGTTGAEAGQTDIPTVLGSIINKVLGIIGSLALVMFIYGGATWMLSGGNQEKVTKGKQILIWATLGIIIIFTAYALVKFVLETITK